MRYLVLSIALLAACGDGGTGSDDSVAGSYSLRTVNGANLPYIVSQVGQD
jgi:hypothetical protein